MGMSEKTDARIVAVSLSPKHGFSKQPQPSVRLIVGEGVEGDAHRGTTVQHLYQKRRTPGAANLAQVHVFSREMLLELQRKGFAIEPGQLGENLLTENLGLLDLPEHTLLRIGEQAVLEVTGLRTPCSKIDAFRPGLQQHLWGERDAGGKRVRRAGIMTAVTSGGVLAPGDPIRIELPPQPWRPLGPV